MVIHTWFRNCFVVFEMPKVVHVFTPQNLDFPIKYDIFEEKLADDY